MCFADDMDLDMDSDSKYRELIVGLTDSASACDIDTNIDHSKLRSSARQRSS